VPQQSIQSHLIGILEIPFDASTVLERRIEEPACRGSVHGYERHLLILSLQTATTLVAGVASRRKHNFSHPNDGRALRNEGVPPFLLPARRHDLQR
jgi:hypothetical protein